MNPAFCHLIKIENSENSSVEQNEKRRLDCAAFLLTAEEATQNLINSMCFKTSYCFDVGIDASTYSLGDKAVKRIQDIYRTRRKGRMKRKLAENLWENFFKQLLKKMPKKEKDFDGFAVKKILELSKKRKLNFGIAQKMFNLFMKDHWALDEFLKKPKLEAVLHLPLDRDLLEKLTNSPWKAWTKVKVTKKTNEMQRKCEYLCIQERFRDYWRSTGVFASPIEMEQFLWHQI